MPIFITQAGGVVGTDIVTVRGNDALTPASTDNPFPVTGEFVFAEPQHVLVDNLPAGFELVGIKGVDETTIATAANPFPVTMPDALTNAQLRASPVEVTAQVTELPVDTYGSKTVTVASSGDNIGHAPAAGKAVRFHWFSYSIDANATTHTTIYLRFGPAGNPMYKVSLNKAGSLFARNIGAGRRYIQGAVDEVLYIVTDTAQIVHVNLEYEEI